MDFDNVLSIASQNQGGSNVQKRYSLQTGPPKKDPKSKGVNPAAIQALLKKQQIDTKMKEIESKKQKEELLAKRVELKSDRKARAMASRTKDNFRGYNGVPVVETPKKRRTKQEMEEERNNVNHSNNFRNSIVDPEDDEDNYEYEQTDSEGEPEPPRNSFHNSSSKSSVKPSAAPKSAPFNFADLLKLAEKKQHEPVELKPKIVKKEERLRTADEIRELELERKAKKLDKCVKGERYLKDDMSHSSSSSSKATLEKKYESQKSRISGSTEKQLHKQEKNNKVNSSAKSSGNDRDKLNSSHKEKNRIKPGSSSSASSKMSSRPSNSEVSAKQTGTKLSSSHKSATSNNLTAKKDNSLLHKGRSEGSPGSRPYSSASSSQKNQPQKREPQRPGTNAPVRSNVVPKPGLSSSSKPGQPQARPGGPPQMKSGVRPGAGGVKTQSVGQSRPGHGGPAPGRATGSAGGETPRCTVVSETISSKNVVGSKAGLPPQPGMGQQRPGMGVLFAALFLHPGPMLPPITSAYKRKFEDEEDDYDSEMDDFIDDGGDEQEEISKHIKQIFGYDRNKYKDESDYALQFMESSWKDMQKEEARSLRMAVQEDLEEEKKEEEEMKRKMGKKPRKK
uniref:Protein SPT2 homolog n=1 Tax=Periophthalmus magnuspinnatus TaxID=409849 RepID=A0A3B3ZSG5_9GOBI